MKKVIEKVAEEFNLTKKFAKDVIDVVFDGMIEEIISEGKLKTKIGTFIIKERAPRIARNPKTGEKVNVNAKRSLVFKSSKDMKNIK